MLGLLNHSSYIHCLACWILKCLRDIKVKAASTYRQRWFWAAGEGPQRSENCLRNIICQQKHWELTARKQDSWTQSSAKHSASWNINEILSWEKVTEVKVTTLLVWDRQEHGKLEKISFRSHFKYHIFKDSFLDHLAPVCTPPHFPTEVKCVFLHFSLHFEKH